MKRNVINVECNDHSYRIVPIEGSDKWYNVIQDGTRVKQISHDELFINGDLINIEEWFKIAKS